jgi:UDP-N-acetylmuramate--alanine ligase
VSGVLEQTKRIHFVGIGGIGMSGIAELLLNLGYQVSGSDVQRTDITDRLESLGARVVQGHAEVNLGDAGVVVYSSAVRSSNPELTAARRLGLATVPRAELLAELMQLRQGIAVAGAHGKTTTTSMIALILDAAGLDPTAVIGGRVSSFGSNARLGRGRYLVAEADESDRSFLKLAPRFAVITNIDREHLEAYRDFDDLKAAFVQFANGVPSSGGVILCADDPHLQSMRADIKRHTITYGLHQTADVTATGLQLKGFGSACTVRSRKSSGRAVDLGHMRLSVPGRHNVLNALAAVAMARELGVAFTDITRAISAFQGVERRFQRRGEVNGVTVVEDYGHHPTEIAAVVAAAQAIRSGRLIIAFQPHRFSRTHFLMGDFGRAFEGADVVVLTDIYGAGEDPIEGVTLQALAKTVARDFTGELYTVLSLSDLPGELSRRSMPGDLIVLLGAGSIGSITGAVLDALNSVEDVGTNS